MTDLYDRLDDPGPMGVGNDQRYAFLGLPDEFTANTRFARSRNGQWVG